MAIFRPLSIMLKPANLWGKPSFPGSKCVEVLVKAGQVNELQQCSWFLELRGGECMQESKQRHKSWGSAEA